MRRASCAASGRAAAASSERIAGSTASTVSTLRHRPAAHGGLNPASAVWPISSKNGRQNPR